MTRAMTMPMVSDPDEPPPSTPATATISPGLILAKRITWIGTTLRNRPIEQKITAVQGFAAEMLPLIAAGSLRPVVDTTFALDDIADAHRHMEADANIGKILLRM